MWTLGAKRLEGSNEVLVLTLASDHQLQDGDMVALDDMRGALGGFNGRPFRVKRWLRASFPRQFKVRRFGVVSPSDAKVDLKASRLDDL